MQHASASRSIGDLELYIGSAIRDFRKRSGMSQEKLGAAVNVTFQQIQKYEKGTNRVAASRLHDIAGALGVPVMAFYPQPQSAAEPTTAGERL